MKKFTLILFLSFSIVSAQKEKSSKMGQTTLEELKMAVYDKDSTASAVILYEHANYYIDKYNKYDFRTDYYFRIKILDKKSFDLADVNIGLYGRKKAIDIKATTYNLTEIGTVNKSRIAAKDIFTVQESGNWTVKKFTLPNIKEGSVLEYSYSILSPYISISDWYFQSDIPKIKSEYDLAILGNYKYNARIVGYNKLDKNDTSIKKNCIYIDGLGQGACSIYSLGMNNVPAFKEEEHMLTKKNYLSRVSFDLKSATSFRGVKEKYATTWKDADKSLKDLFFNNQTSKKNYFKKRLPEEIINTENTLEKVKKVFNFIRNHFTWNKKNWTNEDARIKEAFEKKVGNVGEINLTLYNALRALKIDANLVVLSTRSHGVPTKIYPIIFDYNYVIIKVIIDGKKYLLDATSKFLPFGQLPIRALNGEGRVISFEEESQWEKLTPKQRTSKNISAKLKLNDDGDLEGNLMIRRLGYFASNFRAKIHKTKEVDYLEQFEDENPDLEVNDYKISGKEKLNTPVTEVFKITLTTNEAITNKIRINPFLFNRVKENPFKLKERMYPVDFAYARRNNYYLSLDIPTGYKISQLPKNKAFSLPNKGGSFILKTVKSESTINVSVRLNIIKRIFSAEEYHSLKEFFKQIIIAENDYIILEKI